MSNKSKYEPGTTVGKYEIIGYDEAVMPSHKYAYMCATWTCKIKRMVSKTYDKICDKCADYVYLTYLSMKRRYVKIKSKRANISAYINGAINGSKSNNTE